jgi:glycosyltransferase involved in cell wall biosynthesis
MPGLIVVTDYGHVNGGAAQVAISSLNRLALAGFDVTFVSSVAPVASDIDHNRIRVVNFGFSDLVTNPSRLDAAIHGIWDRRCARQLGVVLEGCDPRDTVIHLHTWVKSLSASVVREVLRRGFKLVVTLHDYFSVCPNGGLYNYVTQKHCDISPMSFSCAITNCDSRSYAQKVWRFSRHLVQQHFAGMPSYVKYFISVSDYSEALLRPYLPSDAKFFRVRNPIDVDQMPPPDPGWSDIFSFVGRLSPEKGAVLFAAAAKKADVRAVFVGTGAEEESIRKANPTAELRGWNDRAGVIANIRASRAVVFPSLWHETQGLVVAEAAALGVPAIVSDGCAARDAVVDGKTGLLFKTGDVDDLASKLTTLKNDPVLVTRLGKAAYDCYWANPCTLEHHVKELVECYQEILA